VAPAAVIALSQWAFATFPLQRLELRHHSLNPASCRVAVKAGYTEFTELREGDQTGHVHSRSQES
jgi:RimJ/RimL family protein N-acetyltransferase